MFPLGLLSAGEQAQVVGVAPARKGSGQVDARVEDIGIRIGKVIEMLNNEGRGPILLKVDESRIAIARGVAMKIMVRRMN